MVRNLSPENIFGRTFILKSNQRMKSLKVQLENKENWEFSFLGWKDDGLSFYAACKDGQPTVITPVSAYAS